MVKKVSGPSSGLTRTTAPQSTKAIQGAKTGGVEHVEAAGRQEQIARAQRKTRRMTAAEREMLLGLIHEEADKMFGPEGLPEDKRETVEGAVKMALEASLIDEEEEEG